MAIKTVHLKNFSLFSDFTLNAVPGINVIIGENGTGKTHILKAIYSVCEISRDEKPENFYRCFPIHSDRDNLLHDKETRTADITANCPEIENKTTELSTYNLFIDGFGEAYEKEHGTKQTVSYIFHYPCKAMQAIYIPVKDMLTHSKGLLEMAEKYRGFPFDKTLLDIIRIAKRLPLNEPPKVASNILPKLENMIGGVVDYEEDEFFIQKHDGRKIYFSIEAEGFKKIGLLWQLLMNESITPGSVLLWDEPDANLNPKFLPTLVDCLLELSRHGVQIFLGTHSYLLAKYFDVKKRKEDSLNFCSLYLENGNVNCESGDTFTDLEHNAILKTFDDLVEVVYGRQLEN